MSKSWTASLRLPKSTFPPRPLGHLRQEYIKRSADDFYEWQKANRPSGDTFVLHDGPPYANGNLHVGHALNKILKDMILRVKVQQGRRVDYIPGWDCHGLPIELKALGDSGGKNLTPIQIRKTARNLASNTVLKQMKTFRSCGVMADWEHRWTTMDAAYELRQLRLFEKMVKKGLIYRRYKPVYWSPSSGTALAEAELEYKDDHISTAAWVRFPVSDSWKNAASELSKLQERVRGNLYALIWTTTPWTLPANQAIAVHDDLLYAIITDGTDSYIVAESRLDVVRSLLPEKEFKIISSGINGSHFRDIKYRNVLKGRSAGLQPVIHADFVSADSGSGLVHLAPGHGFDDYEVCRVLGLPVTAPIDDQGRFTADALPDDPERLMAAPSINEGGSQTIVELLADDVLCVEKYKHKYPYDWRTKKPVVIRATEQWFADVASIKDEALSALDRVRFTPEMGKKRLESFVKGRSEWCISRQRSWGVPIPALYDKNGAAVVDEHTVQHIISVIQQRGTNAWWSDSPDDTAWIPAGLPQGEYRRGTDTMDVWFDSGSSWSMLSDQADVYLEGSDQHRGWFQSSLLTRIAAGAVEGVDFVKGSPFKQLITHGFTLDQDGKKMSKSLGNIIEPHQVIDGSLLPPLKRKGKAAPASDTLGPDALRLWAASSDYTKDVAIGVNVLQIIHAALIKYRIIAKMLLGSMHKSARTCALSTSDHIAIVQLQDTMEEVGKAFDNHEFYKGFNILNRWITNDLSSFYLEASKDRLYCGDGGGVLEPIFNGLMRMLSPMTPSLVEEAWDHRPEWMKNDPLVMHPLHQIYNDPLIDSSRLSQDLTELRKDIPTLMAVHAAIKPALEKARTDKVVGSSLQSAVILTIPDSRVASILEKYSEELDAMFVVSSLEINGAIPESAEWSYVQEFDLGTVTVLPPNGGKCPRCWRYVAPVEEELCDRCEDEVKL
ncbi:isoleucyl-tRNA synthetase [Xylariales sp. PMI_506]|nr:isoleucyl-tRNA synthetase [Xylariales sp. PMI_506]